MGMCQSASEIYVGGPLERNFGAHLGKFHPKNVKKKLKMLNVFASEKKHQKTFRTQWVGREW